MVRAPVVIECSNCGHDILTMHDMEGCHQEGCPCHITWKETEKVNHRRYLKRERLL